MQSETLLRTHRFTRLTMQQKAMAAVATIASIHCSSLGQCLLDVGDDVLDVFDSGGDADESVGNSELCSSLCADCCMGHRCRMAHESLHAAERLREITELQLRYKSIRLFERAKLERKHRPKALLLFGCEIVLWMRLQSGIEHTLRSELPLEPLRDLAPIRVVLLHANSQRLHSAQQQVRIKWREDPTCALLHEPKLVRMLGLRTYQHATEPIRVAV